MKKSKDDLSEIKYARVGHTDQGRNCDRLVNAAVDLLGDIPTLPPRWSWKSRESFLQTYKHRLIWSKTQSYHLLMVDGIHALRIWTDSPDSCLVDVGSHLVDAVRAAGFEIETTPKSSQRKTKPMTYRTRVFKDTEVQLLLVSVLMAVAKK